MKGPQIKVGKGGEVQIIPSEGSCGRCGGSGVHLADFDEKKSWKDGRASCRLCRGSGLQRKRKS
jgi:hypothetical protein